MHWQVWIRVRTVDGVVVRVLSGRAARLQLLRRLGGGSDSVRAEEAVHVARVLARQNDRVDVLQHKVLRDRNGVSIGGRRRRGKERQEALLHDCFFVCSAKRETVWPKPTNGSRTDVERGIATGA